MAQLLIENLEDDVQDKLAELARDHGRTVADEAHYILREAVTIRPPIVPNLGSRIAACFTGNGLEQDIAELRGHLVEPITFDQ